MSTKRKIILTIVISALTLVGFSVLMLYVIVHFANTGYISEILELIFAAVYLLAVLSGLTLFIIDRIRARKESRPGKELFTLWFVSSLVWAAIPLLLLSYWWGYYLLFGGDPFP